jgi:site-specific DNA-cytosine methylase
MLQQRGQLRGSPRVGRAKLRTIAEHPQALEIGPRANLHLRYLHYVDQLKPLAALMENVPNILNHGGQHLWCQPGLRPLRPSLRFGITRETVHGHDDDNRTQNAASILRSWHSTVLAALTKRSVNGNQ